MRILISSGIGTPSACEKSRTVTPDWTVTGPVGATTSRGCLGGPTSCRPRPWRPGGPPPRWPPWSITTRRLPRGLAPPRGLIGLFGLFAMNVRPSVEAAEHRIDRDALPEHAVEASSGQGPFEAEQPLARVDAAAGKRPARPELAVDGREAYELRLRGLAAAAGARPD